MSKLLDAVSLFARPLGRIADQLENLHNDALRYFDAAKIPPLPTEDEINLHAEEPAVVGPVREDWELAIDEEIAARKAAADREIKVEKTE